METKQAYIQRIVTEHPADGHKLGIQTNYLVCEKCGMRTLRNSVREKIQQLHESPCWNGAWELPNQWAGHPTHEIWRRANRAYCSKCHACAVAKGGHWHPSKQLQRICTKNQQTQLPLCFRAKTAELPDNRTKKVREKNIYSIYIYIFCI